MRRLRPHDPPLDPADGKPWREDNCSHSSGAAVRTAGLTGLSFHGLRKAASATLAETGAPDAEIYATLGHVDPKMTRLYRAQANQRTLAASALRRVPTRNGDHIPVRDPQ